MPGFLSWNALKTSSNSLWSSGEDDQYIALRVVAPWAGCAGAAAAGAVVAAGAAGLAASAGFEASAGLAVSAGLAAGAAAGEPQAARTLAPASPPTARARPWITCRRENRLTMRS